MKKKSLGLYKKLIKGVENILKEQKFKEFLVFAKKFRRYSLHNIMLVYQQRPDATMVAGMKTWNSLGRRVKRGEKGIAIFAPIIKKEVVIEEETEEETEEVKEIGVVAGYKVTYVWDISQTYGKPVPEPPVGGLRVNPGVNLKNLLEVVLESVPVPVSFKPLPDGKYGYYYKHSGEIVINAKLTPEEKLATIFHEWAHHLLLLSSVKFEAVEDEARRSIEEAIVESVAYMVSHELGVDTSKFSFAYVATWQPEAVLKYGKIIMKTYEQIAEKLTPLLTTTP